MLLCILTGGNIDLAVGSVVCFTGAVGVVLMERGVNLWLAVLVMLLVGLAIGAFQGFWIAKVYVPAFIATLAGMYAFRGLSNVVLQGYTVTISNESFLRIFGGGADCYIPDFLGGDRAEPDLHGYSALSLRWSSRCCRSARLPCREKDGHHPARRRAIISDGDHRGADPLALLEAGFL